MIDSLEKRFSLLESGVKGTRTYDKIGTILNVTGLILESEGTRGYNWAGVYYHFRKT